MCPIGTAVANKRKNRLGSKTVTEACCRVSFVPIPEAECPKTTQ